MPAQRQREWVSGVLEGAPSILFLALWRSNIDGEVAGWIGSGLAAALLIGFRLRRVPYNPLLLGINFHLVVMTPLVVSLFRLGMPETARFLLDTAESGVLVAILAVGCGLTAFAPRGFIGAEGLPAATRRAYSLLLLAATAAAIPWSIVNAGSTLLSIGVPLMGLFALRRFLMARWSDKAREPGGGSFAIAGVPPGDAD